MRPIYRLQSTLYVRNLDCSNDEIQFVILFLRKMLILLLIRDVNRKIPQDQLLS